VSDSGNSNPNGLNGEAIASLMITMDGETYVDHAFETFYSMDCLGLQNVVPVLNVNGNANSIITANQVTEFDEGIAKWNLGYDASSDEYMEYVNCGLLPAGTFQWVELNGDDVRLGEIVLDII
jgi:hypothetical protein